MAYAIGLDIGIASVGWATVKLDHDEQPWTIDKMEYVYLIKQNNQKQENHWQHHVEQLVV